jgi:hypothetical protein
MFLANDQDFLCHSSVLSFEDHKFFFGLIPDREKVKSYIFRYNKLKNIRFYIFISCFYMLFERLMVVLNVLKEKTPIRMVGDSVSQCGFSVVNFHKYKHFFSFCNFKNEEFHTFAPSYDLTKL